MSNIDIVKAALKNNMDKRVVHKPNVLKAEAKGTASKQAFEAKSGDIDQLDLDYLDSLNRIQGTLKNTYMESISANKITSGSILGTNLTLAGTEASSNKTTLTMIGDALLRVNDGTQDRVRLSNNGLQFLSIGSFQEAANSNIASKMVSIPAASDGVIFSALGFAVSSTTARRGALTIAHGAAGAVIDGLIRLAATTAPTISITDPTSAYIDIYSRSGAGTGRVDVVAQLYAMQYAEMRGNTKMLGSLDVGLNAVFRSAVSVLGTPTTLKGVDAVNVRVSGQYNNTGVLALFGGGITTIAGITSGGAVVASGNVLADGGNLVGDGLNVRSGTVAMPANSIDGTILQAHPSNNTLRAVGANHIRFLAVSADHLGDGSATLRVINNNLFNPAQDSVGLRTISPLLGGTSLQTSSGNHSHASGETSSFEVLPVAERRRSLAQRLTLRRRLRDLKPLDASEGVDVDKYNRLLNYVKLMSSQVQTLSHLLQDAPDRDAFEREDMFRRGEITDENIFFEFRHGHRESEGKHIALLPHKWTENAHPDLVA